jgi:two-component system, sensor histidine kinase and response regulator
MDPNPTKTSTILVVDDNPLSLHLLFSYLNQSGFKVLVSKDGQSAIEQTRLARPNLILLDVVMPETDGFETCRLLKEDSETSDIPVIFMTALSETTDKVRGFQVGAVDFITKPLEYEELLVRVNTHLTLGDLHRELQERNTCLEQEVTRREKIEAILKTYMAKLERSNEELKHFAYVASHDLQEPLRTITSYLQLLERRYKAKLDDNAQDFIMYAVDGAERMKRLITDLLAYSQVTNKAQAYKKVDLRQVVQEVLSDLEVRLKQVEGRVEVDNLPTIEAEPLQMRQLFQNLISNALKFHRKDEPPLVRIKGVLLNEQQSPPAERFPVTEVWQITVADNGVGFDEKDRDRIFQMFQRLYSRIEFEGTGIGLTICRKIAERHGGTITAQSSPGQGATFIVTLPVTQESPL